jgi:hypothetical protein|tara:strand:- start:811 stop:1032 length:222 start_codon:yes stop_codon:yes gene_type:complete
MGDFFEKNESNWIENSTAMAGSSGIIERTPPKVPYISGLKQVDSGLRNATVNSFRLDYGHAKAHRPHGDGGLQ